MRKMVSVVLVLVTICSGMALGACPKSTPKQSVNATINKTDFQPFMMFNLSMMSEMMNRTLEARANEKANSTTTTTTTTQKCGCKKRANAIEQDILNKFKAKQATMPAFGAKVKTSI